MIVTRQRTQKNCSSTVKPNITSFIELVLEDRMNREVMLKLTAYGLFFATEKNRTNRNELFKDNSVVTCIISENVLITIK